LRRADPPSKESYGRSIGSRNLRSGQCSTKGCRVIIIIIIYMQESTKINLKIKDKVYIRKYMRNRLSNKNYAPMYGL
jgi:hypothetical protein